MTRHGPVTIREKGTGYLALRWSAAEPSGFQFPFSGFEPREQLERVHRRAGALSRARARISCMPTWTETSAITPRASFRSARITTATCRWTAARAISNGKASFRSINCRRSTIRRKAGSSPPIRIRFRTIIPTAFTASFAAPYRSLEIRSLLASHDGWKPDDMLAVEKDVYSAFSSHLAHMMVAAYDRSKPAGFELERCSRRAAILERPDGKAAPPRRMLISRGVPGICGSGIADSAAPGKSDLYGAANGAGGDGADSESRRARLVSGSRRAADASAFGGAFENGRRSQGSNVKRWDYGSYNELTIKHPVGKQVAAAGAVLQHRAGADERLVDHHQADHASAGAIHAICRGSGGLGSLAQQHHDRAVRADFVAALQGSVGCVLCGAEFSDAV